MIHLPALGGPLQVAVLALEGRHRVATRAARKAKGAVLAPYLTGISVELTGIEPVTS